MKRRDLIYLIIGAVFLIAFLIFSFSGNRDVTPVASPKVDSISVNNKVIATPPSATPPKTNIVINYQKYNIDYMNDDIKNILVKEMGANGKTSFYLPSTGYINISKGTKYGVAFVIQNMNPTIPNGNEFAYNFKADPSSVNSCGVSIEKAQSWIERGWASSGMIGGQWRADYNDWHDAMTVYFAFPSGVRAGCNIKYNFVITKDGKDYDSKTLEFNLI